LGDGYHWTLKALRHAIDALVSAGEFLESILIGFRGVIL